MIAASWVDFHFFYHQLPLHLRQPFSVENTGVVDHHNVPMPHLGVILEMPVWKVLANKLEPAGLDFVLVPEVRFLGDVGEQSTMFFRDPSGNPIEIKGFSDFSGIFNHDEYYSLYF